VSTAVLKGSGMVTLRHARGTLVLPQGPFVGGPPPTARALTNLDANALVPLTDTLELQAGALGALTVLDSQAPLLTLGATAGVTARFGRIAVFLQYQFSRADTAGAVTMQHFLRAGLARPFEL
jgi:hypothetical protein